MTERGDKTRQQLLDAATKVFSMRGFARATTREIAKVAGVAEGTIYRHFPDKQTLFYEAFSAKNPFTADEFLRLPELAGKETVHENLRRFMSVIEDIVRTTAPLEASMWSDAELMEALREAGRTGEEEPGRPADPLLPLAKYLEAEQGLGRVRDGVDYQHTGEVRRVDAEAIRGRLDTGAIVLIPPLGYSPTGEVFNLQAPLIGRHSIHTILRAISVGLIEGLTWGEIITGLHHASSQLRLVVVQTRHGALLLDDTYNASPESMLAALNLLHELQGRRIAVLGGMNELGPYELAGHQKVGMRAAEVADELITYRENGRMIHDAAAAVGFQAEHLSHLQTEDEVVSRLDKMLRAGDVVLLKGAHSLRMDNIVQALEVEE